MRMLARRDHASGELRQKLQLKGFTREEADAALASLVSAGYLDDARWASEFARRHLGDGRGWHWIRLRIARAGAVPPPAPPPSLEARYLLALLARRGVDPSALTDLREKAKIIRFLRGRGYRTAAISIAFGPGVEEEDED